MKNFYYLVVVGNLSDMLQLVDRELLRDAVEAAVYEMPIRPVGSTVEVIMVRGAKELKAMALPLYDDATKSARTRLRRFVEFLRWGPLDVVFALLCAFIAGYAFAILVKTLGS